jgi:hypothetical protein
MMCLYILLLASQSNDSIRLMCRTSEHKMTRKPIAREAQLLFRFKTENCNELDASAPSGMDSIASDTRPVKEQHESGGGGFRGFCCCFVQQTPSRQPALCCPPICNHQSIHVVIQLFTIALQPFFCRVRLFNRSC